MNQKRLQESLTLIHQLLTCPEGEEWVLLKKYEALVDANFVQLMEQVAAQLWREGDRHAAKYLHNWAAQLHHILIKEVPPLDANPDQTQSYIDLIQALIDAPESDAAKILAQQSELIGPGLVNTMHQVIKKMAAQGIYDKAQYLEALANQINQAWIQTHVWPQQNGRVKSSPDPLSSSTSSTSEAMARSADRAMEPAVPSIEGLAPPPSSTSAPTPAPTSAHPVHASKEQRERLLDHSPSTQPPSATGEASDSTMGETNKNSKVSTFDSIPDPWGSTPLSSAMKLKVPQQIANGLQDVALLLHQIDKTLSAQTQVLQTLATQVPTPSHNQVKTTNDVPHNPLWYMDVLERACDRAWVLTTDEIEQLIGVKPKCHAEETVYERGCWRFEKAGKLGAKVAWRVYKAETD